MNNFLTITSVYSFKYYVFMFFSNSVSGIFIKKIHTNPIMILLAHSHPIYIVLTWLKVLTNAHRWIHRDLQLFFCWLYSCHLYFTHLLDLIISSLFYWIIILFFFTKIYKGTESIPPCLYLWIINLSIMFISLYSLQISLFSFRKRQN